MCWCLCWARRRPEEYTLCCVVGRTFHAPLVGAVEVEAEDDDGQAYDDAQRAPWPPELVLKGGRHRRLDRLGLALLPPIAPCCSGQLLLPLGLGDTFGACGAPRGGRGSVHLSVVVVMAVEEEAQGEEGWSVCVLLGHACGPGDPNGDARRTLDVLLPRVDTIFSPAPVGWSFYCGGEARRGKTPWHACSKERGNRRACR